MRQSGKVKHTTFSGACDVHHYREGLKAAYRATHRAAARLGVRCSMREPHVLEALKFMDGGEMFTYSETYRSGDE